MADQRSNMPQTTARRVARALFVTRAGLLAETLLRGFWPLWSLLILLLAAALMGLHEQLSLELIWSLGLISATAAIWLFWHGLRRFRWPRRDDAIRRLDATLPARPLAALADTPAIGSGDTGSEAVWAAHRARMTATLSSVSAPDPDLRLARFDPFGLRHIALLALAVALLFGSLSRLGTVGAAVAGQAPGSTATLSGPSWEGWVEPPLHTGKPALYLPDLEAGSLEIVEGSEVIIRLYGEVGALTLTETVSARTDDVPSAAAPEQSFTIARSGAITIDGPGGRHWDVALIPDTAPRVTVNGEATVSARGEMSLPFAASDDFAVTGGTARIALDLASVDRRYGLRLAPEPRDAIEIALPLPISGSRADFEEVLIEDFSEHPWAHLPVTISLTVEDATSQTGAAEPLSIPLPARRFFDPLAAAVIELRRDLLWSRENAPRIAQLLRAISHRPGESVFQSETTYLRMRTILRRLENSLPYGLTDAQQTEYAKALWDLAILLEEGNLDDALAKMQRARDRLAEAMKNGASDSEIARLMQELREATQDYLRELARQQNQERENGDETERQFSENSTTLNNDDLQRMMDRIQELMEQGRMAEAMQALQEFQEMMENMRVTQGGEGNGEQNPGDRAMRDLADTLRNQQGLSDEAFRQLQERFNPDANRGQSGENTGRNGGEGRGQAHDGTGDGGEGQQGQGQNPGEGAEERSLAERQQQLREQLDALRRNMPGQNTEEGQAAGDALDRAGDAMDGAEQALRGDDLAEAIDRQAEAMDQMREGMRNLGEAMARNQQQGQGQQGQDMRGAAQGTDPLGRPGNGGRQSGPGEDMLQGEDVYRQARDLLDEIRRRAGETERSEEERNYLRRLLDRF
ncbi:TIGR02302 family protein [Shimia aestuarii]|uniref:TIGR02302 family protein n=1 Tax=Shimia aestuarii TaxID=254406 RepID=UPI001FB267DA|nr:TIGR02302 family protein [Shimia aestuarii]